MITHQQLQSHFLTMAGALGGTRCTNDDNTPVALHDAFTAAIKIFMNCKGKIIFIGNGGSAGIASHFAIDFTKNGGMRAVALNDAVAITCASNDYGYENGFAELLNHYADFGDVVVAISSSGKSSNILNAVKAATQMHCQVITLSGFKPDNPLRQMGDLNFYVASDAYGFVECTHMALLHSMLDLAFGVKS